MCESDFSISPQYHTWNEEFLCIPPVVEESRHSYITYCIVDLCCFKQDIESSCRKLGCNWTIQVVVIILWRLPIKGTVIGKEEKYHEMFAAFYPSHSAFLQLSKSANDSKIFKNGKENFRLRNLTVEHATIYRTYHSTEYTGWEIYICF